MEYVWLRLRLTPAWTLGGRRAESRRGPREGVGAGEQASRRGAPGTDVASGRWPSRPPSCSAGYSDTPSAASIGPFRQSLKTSFFTYQAEFMGSTPAAGANLRAALSYCVQQVRNYDYHHYLCLLHLPPSMRKAAFAFRALNVETAKAMDVVSDPKTGLMRLLWWKDVIDKIFANKLVEHPVAQVLSSVVSERKISKHWLKRSVEARINDANQDDYAIPETVSELERYAEDTQSTILYMTLQAGGIQSTIADHAASHIGKASGLLLLLKALPHHVSKQGRIPYIPASIAEECGLLTREGGRSEVRMADELPDAVFKVASVADAHLEKARELASSVPTEAIPVLLPGVPAQVLMDSLRSREFNVFDSRLARGVHGISPLWYQIKLNWHAWQKKY